MFWPPFNSIVTFPPGIQRNVHCICCVRNAMSWPHILVCGPHTVSRWVIKQFHLVNSTQDNQTLSTVVSGFTGLCNGFFFSAVCSTASDAMLLATVNTFLSISACGNIWPLACMRYQWMESVAWYFPHTATLMGIRDITLRGWGVEAPAVRYSLYICTSWKQ